MKTLIDHGKVSVGCGLLMSRPLHIISGAIDELGGLGGGAGEGVAPIDLSTDILGLVRSSLTS